MRTGHEGRGTYPRCLVGSAQLICQALVHAARPLPPHRMRICRFVSIARKMQAAAAAAPAGAGPALSVAALPGCGHSVVAERPEALVPLLRVFADGGDVSHFAWRSLAEEMEDGR